MKSILKGVLIASVGIPAFAMVLIALCSVFSIVGEPDSEEWAEQQRSNTSIACWFSNVLSTINKSDATQNFPSIQEDQDTGKYEQYC